MRRLIGAVAGLLLAAIMIFRPEDVPPAYALWVPLDPAAVPNFVTRLKLIQAAHDPAYCRAALGRGQARALAIPDRVISPQCHVSDAVRLEALSTARLTPEATRCKMALRFYMWERHALKPAAREILGAGVVAVDHYGSYNCQPLRTDRGPTSRMSEHPTANAFDISGFTLADGRRILLRKDWPAGNAKAEFLRAARDGMCRYFRVVLSPDYNALHADHFHVDQGMFLTCR